MNMTSKPISIGRKTLIGSVYWQTEHPDRNFHPNAKQIEDSFNAFNGPDSKKVEVVTKTPPISQLSEEISSSQFSRLTKIIEDNQALFMQDKYDFGHTDLIKHRIELMPDAKPHKEPPRRMTWEKRNQLDEKVEELIKGGNIKPSTSPWGAGVVMVRKKGTSDLRMCIDFRMLNEQTVKDVYPLPRIDDSLNDLAHCRYFTTLDMGSAFWQVSLSEEDQIKTAFATHSGLFQWTRMPFGLCNATATFQRLMNMILKSEDSQLGNIVLCYVDDILIATKTVDQHLERLSSVFQKLAKAGLKLKPKKCVIMSKSIKYLGRIIDQDGCRPDPEAVEVVKNWQAPKDMSTLRSFLGFANYYREFIKDYAEKISPLQDLVKKDKPWEWHQVHQDTFEMLKKLLNPWRRRMTL